MSRIVVLDSGPLGMVAHPRPNPQIARWLLTLVQTETTIVVPEIADYEVRRELLLQGLAKSIARLDELKRVLTYLPLTTETMLQAAAFWADTRQQGRPTADPRALDGDVILAAQAFLLTGDGAEVVIATTNVKHLAHLVPARLWSEI